MFYKKVQKSGPFTNQWQRQRGPVIHLAMASDLFLNNKTICGSRPGDKWELVLEKEVNCKRCLKIMSKGKYENQ